MNTIPCFLRTIENVAKVLRDHVVPWPYTEEPTCVRKESCTLEIGQVRTEVIGIWQKSEVSGLPKGSANRVKTL